MKNLRLLTGLILSAILSFSFTACSDDDDESVFSEWEHVLNNHGSNYDFNDKGQCLGNGGGISPENFEKVFVGYGWKNSGTWEIDENGYRLPDEFYSSIDGISPYYFYFAQDNTVTTYYRSDADAAALVSSTEPFTFDRKYEGESRAVVLFGYDFYLQITGWCVGEHPRCCFVHPLGIMRDDRQIYGVSIYTRMSDEELNKLQSER